MTLSRTKNKKYLVSRTKKKLNKYKNNRTKPRFSKRNIHKIKDSKKKIYKKKKYIKSGGANYNHLQTTSSKLLVDQSLNDRTLVNKVIEIFKKNSNITDDKLVCTYQSDDRFAGFGDCSDYDFLEAITLYPSSSNEQSNEQINKIKEINKIKKIITEFKKNRNEPQLYNKLNKLNELESFEGFEGV